MSNYREIPALLAARIPFEGNTMSARMGRNRSYVVYSYATEIARVEDGVVTFNDTKYSRTTSRQQNLCHNHL